MLQALKGMVVIMKSELELKKEVCEIGKRLYVKGLLASTDGSISVKVNESEYLCTATGTNKGFMTLDTVCKVDNECNSKLNNGYRVTSAVKTHMLIHKVRPEMHAVIHAYPSNATTYANAGVSLSQPASLEAINSIGCIPYLEKGLVSTEDEISKLTEMVQHFDAILFGDIGVLAFGTTLEAAYNKLESVELYASTMAKSKELGLNESLTDTQQKEMFRKREKYGFTKKHSPEVCVRMKEGKPGCYSCGKKSENTVVLSENDEFVQKIKQKVMEQMNLK